MLLCLSLLAAVLLGLLGGVVPAWCICWVLWVCGCLVVVSSLLGVVVLGGYCAAGGVVPAAEGAVFGKEKERQYKINIPTQIISHPLKVGI